MADGETLAILRILMHLQQISSVHSDSHALSISALSRVILDQICSTKEMKSASSDRNEPSGEARPFCCSCYRLPSCETKSPNMIRF
jgi:hypothetical protein